MLSLLIFLFRFTIKYSDSEIMRIMYIVVPPRGVVLNDESTGAFQHSHVDAARLMYYGSVFVLFFFYFVICNEYYQIFNCCTCSLFSFFAAPLLSAEKNQEKDKRKKQNRYCLFGVECVLYCFTMLLGATLNIQISILVSRFYWLVPQSTYL